MPSARHPRRRMSSSSTCLPARRPRTNRAPPAIADRLPMQEELQPLIEHLIELRTRLVRAAVVLLVAFLILFHWSGDLYHLLALPMLKAMKAGSQMIATDVTSTFFVPLK